MTGDVVRLGLRPLGFARLDITRLDVRLRRRAMFGYAIGLALYTLAVVAMYPSFKDDASLDKLVQSDPTLMAAFGVSGSLTSPVGWLNANIFNNFLPMIVVIVAIGYGAWCIAGQDESGTLALVASLPIDRPALVVQKAIALVVQLLPTMVLTFLCVLLGRTFDLTVAVGNLGAVSVAVLLLGAVFGALASFVGVVSSSRGVAIGVASGVAATSYLISSLASTIDWIRPARVVSPFYWAVGGNPLENGLGLGAAAALVCTTLGFLAATVVAMRHADLH